MSLTVGPQTGSPTAPCLTGLADSARIHGARDVAVGFVALLDALTEVLCRLLGTELALRILEQATGASLEAVPVTVPSPPAGPELPTMVDES